MGGCDELKWVCDQCGCSFNPTECRPVWNYNNSTELLSVIIYCPNPDCRKPWINVCHKLGIKNE